MPEHSGPTAPAADSDARALDRVVAGARRVLSAVRGIPRVLNLVLAGSVLSGIGLAWYWFLARDSIWLQWLAAPWLVLVAAPQLGLWLLARSVSELVALPERLLAVKSELADQGEQLLRQIRRAETEDLSEQGFLTRLRGAYRLHGELSQIVAARAVLHRFTGPLAVAIGPVSFFLNCAIIALGLLQLVFAAT